MKRALLLFLTSCGGLAFSPLVDGDAGDAGGGDDAAQLGEAGGDVAGDDAAAPDVAVVPDAGEGAAADAGPDASGAIMCCTWVDGGAHLLSCNGGAWGCYVDGSAVAFSCSNTSDPCAIGDRCVVNNTFQYGEVHVCP